MTCIVGMIDKKDVYIGGDSCGYASVSWRTMRSDSKVFRRGDMIMGYTTSFRMGHLLHWKFEVPKHPAKMSVDKYMNTVFVDAVMKCFKDNAYTKIKDCVEIGGTFLVGYRGRLFYIEDDFQVGENLEGVAACGCGREHAMAVTYVLKNMKILKPKKIIELALKTAEHYSGGVMAPFKILFLEGK